MKDADTLKKIVKDKYAGIAVAADSHRRGCCGEQEPDYSVIGLDYAGLDGYVANADLKLGCGIPTKYAGITEGDDVLDLGSGAGNDCFVARSIVGPEGSVTGLDFTDEMVDKANRNNAILGYENVKFVKGDIEQIPLADNSYDVVISNCVLNLVPDKRKAFSEVSRILRKGGHFCVSDIVLKGELPEELKEAAALYAGCVSGALQKEDYLQIIRESGFTDMEVREEVIYDIPDEYLLRHVSEGAVARYRASNTGIFSITVVGYKRT